MTSRARGARPGPAWSRPPHDGAPARWLARLAHPVDPAAATERSARCPASAAEWRRFAVIALQVALCVLVVRQFQIESRAFATVSAVAFGGFLVHAVLPLRYRMAFFATLSLGTLVLVLGGNAMWVIGIGAALIGIAVLPVSAGVRVALVAAAGAGLALMRGNLLATPFPAAVWPVLGSMFMFRLIVFLYERAHGARSRSIWETISYFFLLPNVCFPLFPVVDYATFRSTYYKEDAWHCAQTGVRWIVRGLLHLLAYRVIYYYGLQSPGEVRSPQDLFVYAVMTWGLYLRVSGNFHVIVGILRLFGFGLPETHFLFFLSAGINDFWRRVNIYWKDFMLKVFYLPAFFRLRKQGEDRAFVLATLYVVVLTWFFHSYQWFWLRGTFPVKWQDGAFWGVLGVLMVWTTRYENRHSKARGRRVQVFAGSDWLGRSARIVITFLFVSMLWSLWTCGSLGEWLEMWEFEGHAAPWSTELTVMVLAALVVCAAFGRGVGLAGERLYRRSLAVSLPVLVGLLSIGLPAVYGRLGPDSSKVVQSLRVARLNRLDAAQLQRGYYEDLQDIGGFNQELARIYKSKPAHWVGIEQTNAMRSTGDFALTELQPSWSGTYKGAAMTVNRWGMRDRDYALAKPPATTRLAWVGGSYLMGSGVGDDVTFEAVVERRLQASPLVVGQRYESMNFGVAGYSPLHRLFALEHRALQFEPDVALYVAHELETFRIVRHLSVARHRGVPPPYRELNAILARVAVDEALPDDVYEKQLEPHAREILAFVYRHYAEVCRAHGVTPVWVMLPTLEMYGSAGDAGWLRQLAADGGCAVIELFGVYDGHDIFDIRVAPWDYHPNAAGHALIADRLFAELTARPELLRAQDR